MSINLPDEMLPDCNCDESRLIQVLLILIDNAINYTHEGGNINLKLDYHNDSFKLLVCDTGCGVPNSENL